MFCNQCGNDLTGMSGRFCNMCGAQVGVTQPKRATQSPTPQQRAVSPRRPVQSSNYTRTSRRQNRTVRGNRTMAIGAIAAVVVIILVVVLLSGTSGNDDETPVEYFLFSADAETQGVRIDEYIGTDINVRIPVRIEGEPVTSIGREAFFESGIMSVYIPDTVAVIERSAFSGSRGLTSVTIGRNTERIGNNAFSGTGLTEIVLPDRVEWIGDEAFAWTNLASVTMGNSVEHIGHNAFTGTDLTSIDIPDSLTTITSGAFPNINDFAEIVIPYGVTTIGSNAFYGLRNLRSVIIPDSVTEICSSAFAGTNLTEESRQRILSINPNAQFER